MTRWTPGGVTSSPAEWVLRPAAARRCRAIHRATSGRRSPCRRGKCREEVIAGIGGQPFRGPVGKRHAIQIRIASQIGVIDQPPAIRRDVGRFHQLNPEGELGLSRSGCRRFGRERDRPGIAFDLELAGRAASRGRARSCGHSSRSSTDRRPVLLPSRHMPQDIPRSIAIGNEVEPSSIRRPDRTLVDRKAVGHRRDHAIGDPHCHDLAGRDSRRGTRASSRWHCPRHAMYSPPGLH